AKAAPSARVWDHSCPFPGVVSLNVSEPILPDLSGMRSSIGGICTVSIARNLTSVRELLP
ncbi:hypothetical protein LOAG_15379, partial [Loa loa]